MSTLRDQGNICQIKRIGELKIIQPDSTLSEKIIIHNWPKSFGRMPD